MRLRSSSQDGNRGIKENEVMKRLCFLLPDVPTAHAVVDELKAGGVEESHLHVIANEGVPLEDLPEASLLEKTDYIRGVEIGAFGGGAIGLLAGLVAVTFPPAGLVLGGGIVLGTTLAGATVSALLSGLIGMDFPNARLEKYQDAIESGQVLMLVDVAESRANQTAAVIKRHHPEVDIGEAKPHLVEHL